MKQTKLWLATIAMLLCSLTASAHDFEVGGIYYSITSSTDQKVAVTYRGSSYNSYSNEYSGAVTIPSTVTYNSKTYSVTSIGSYAFFGCSSLTAITIPEGVTNINDYAFYGCSSLTAITIPESVTSIGSYAFYDCSSLTEVHISDIAAWCSIKFSDNPFRYVHNLYLNGELVTELTIPDGVTSIRSCAFYGCSSLTSITIPESVTSIGYYAFCGCRSLTAITIPESVTSIGSRAFEDCSSLTSITIPEGVKSIGYYAFCGCSSLTSINIPESVTSIGNYAFEDCSSLTSITIPEGVSSIGNYAFEDCSSLTAVHINSLEAWCNIDFASSSNPLSYAKNLYLNGELLTALTIPEGVTNINDYAFSGCSSLTSITIPESVTSIGRYAFSGCSSLTSITIPENSQLTSIDYHAFLYCSSLTSINIPEGVTSIGSSAFSGCSSLASITIPENSQLTSIGSSAFYGCSSLTAITIPESVTSIGDYAFQSCSSLTSINIPEGVTSIGSSAFYGCSNLYKVINYSNLSLSPGSSGYGYVAYYAKQVIEGNELTTVGDFQFRTSNGVHYLVNYIGQETDVVLPDNYNGASYDIGNYAFYGCSSLASITIPESVTSIGSGAFRDCTALKEVIFEDGSETLSLGYNYYNSSYTGEGLFCDCPLESVYLGRNLSYSSGNSYGYSPFYNKTKLTSLTIGNNVTSIGNYAFYYCSSLYKVINYSNLSLSAGSSGYGYVTYYAKQVIKGNGLTTVGDFQFLTSNGVHYLVNYIGKDSGITLPNDYNGSNYDIGACAFLNCSSLTAITIPECVAGIEEYAFYGCSSLYKVTNYSNLSLSTGSSDYGYVAYYAKQVIKESELTTVGDFQFRTSNGVHYLVNYIGKDSGITLPNDYNGANYGIGACAFSGCSSLTFITIPESVTTIEECAFDGCSSLHSVTIGSGVLSIGSNAFSTPDKVIWLTNTPPTGYANAKGNINYVSNNQYTNLSNVQIYPYLSSMFEVDGVKYVPVSPSERTCHAIDCAYDESVAAINVGETVSFKGVAMKVTEVMPYTFYGNNYIEEVLIAHLGSIGGYAFYNCNRIKDVTISNLGNIGSQAFYNCDAIESVKASNQGNIGDRAFYDCNSIKTVEVNNRGVIGGQAFYGCSGMETAVINNVGKVELEAFSDCSSLQTVTLGDSIGSLGNKAFYQCTNLQEIVIPDPVKAVGEYCFGGCSAMKRATIGDGVCSIATYTFQGCTMLEDVVIGDGVTTISNYAFTGCSALTNVELGNSVATINNYAFQNCSSLPEISIPQAVTTIGDYAFSGCTQLADIIIEDRTTALNLGSNGSSALFVDCPLDSVYIGGKITYNTTSSKGYSPFYRNTSLRSVVITDREEQIYDNEFYGCTNLQNVTIGNGVKSIGDYAFSGCSSLAGFSFGSNMETIGAEAFSDCTNLTSITSHAAVPPTCGTQALDDINKWNCVLGVPLGNADAYYAADQWKEFFFIEDVVEVDHYILTYMVDGEVYHTEVLKHKDEVTMLAEPTKVGYEFSGWDKTLTTMPAEDVVISGTFVRLPIENIIILDTENSFVVDEEMECKAITYTRTFTDTKWQALYVPFDIVVTEALLADFDIAYLNDIRQYDHDDDGTKDETVVEAFKMESGVLEANYPYLIRAKEVGEKCIALTDATLYATEENSYDCSSLYELYTFTGTYNTMSSDVLIPDEGYYTLIDGEWRLAEEETLLGAFRFYLKVDGRNGEVAAAQAIRMRVVGDDNDDENTEGDTTGVAPSTLNAQPSSLYDLMGRRVEKATKGIYIVNGKKTVVK